MSNVNSAPGLKNGVWPCSVCKRDMGSNSMHLIMCGGWVHKRCTLVIGSLRNVVDFTCNV